LDSIPGLEIRERELRLANCAETDFKQLLALLAAEGLDISRMKYGYGNLEDLFLHLTGRQLRD
ncbi:MAG: ABC transporter ATP-binding protein, partial [Gammaproteobacteria bacterium]